MSAAIDLIARHLAAAWNFDWANLDRTLTNNPTLRISSGDLSYSERSVYGIYRHISQAWNFLPGDTQLSEAGPGMVHVKMRLTNGGGWAKDVEGDYRVKGACIDGIEFIDGLAFEICASD